MLVDTLATGRKADYTSIWKFTHRKLINTTFMGTNPGKSCRAPPWRYLLCVDQAPVRARKFVYQPVTSG